MARTALVTGANRGIGLALCRRLKERGRDVIAVCRKSSPALDALGVRVEEGVDVTSDEAVSGLMRRLEGVVLDELICNAGILREDALDDRAYESIREQFEVNALAPLRVVAALRRNVRRGGKVALITSRMGSIGDNGSGGSYGYGMSLARDLASSGIAVAILHPGYVRTDMTEGSGNIDPEGAAAQLVDRLDALTAETTGTFWHANGQVLPW
jgi:NAD(P)-dependent dehydrogenase (short-subunit alcohol dehydrogenase family)